MANPSVDAALRSAESLALKGNKATLGDAVDAVSALVAAVAAQARQLDQVTRQLADVSKALDRQIKRDRQVRNSLHAAGIKVI